MKSSRIHRMNELYISGQYEEYGEPLFEETFIRNAINRLSNTTTKEKAVFFTARCILLRKMLNSIALSKPVI